MNTTEQHNQDIGRLIKALRNESDVTFVIVVQCFMWPDEWFRSLRFLSKFLGDRAVFTQHRFSLKSGQGPRVVLISSAQYQDAMGKASREGTHVRIYLPRDVVISENMENALRGITCRDFDTMVYM